MRRAAKRVRRMFLRFALIYVMNAFARRVMHRQSWHLELTMASSQPSTFDELAFREEPPSTSLRDGRLTITAPPLVDWWRNPEPVLVNRKDGPFKYRLIDGSRPFECDVWLRSGLVGLYDQACMVLHGGDLGDPKAHWLKTGTETFSGRQWIKSVCLPQLDAVLLS